MGKTTIDKIIARIMMVSFFLPMKWQPMVVISTSVYFVICSLYTSRSISRQNLLWALFLGAGYLLYLGAILFTPHEFARVANKYLEYRLSYIVFPVIFALVSKDYLDTIFNELRYFVYAAVVMCIATNAAFVYKYAVLPTGFHGVTHVAYREGFEKICGLHPTYMTMYMVFSAGFLLVQGNAINKFLKYSLFYALLAFILPLLAKSPIIAMAVMLLHQLWLRRGSLLQYKWLFAGMLAVLVASYLFVPFVSQRVQEMAGLSGGAMKGNVTDNSIYVRKLIWTVDTNMLRHYWLAGCGPGRLMYLLHVRYLFYSLQYGYDISALDPHNEYFYQWISFGLSGILVLLSALFMHFCTAIKHSNFLYLYLMLILSITFFTESVLAWQQGIIFYSFFSGLFFFMLRGKRNIA